MQYANRNLCELSFCETIDDNFLRMPQIRWRMTDRDKLRTVELDIIGILSRNFRPYPCLQHCLMSDLSAIRRQLKIKTGSVNR